MMIRKENNRPGRPDKGENNPRREGGNFERKRSFGTGRPAGAGPARGGFAAKRPGFGAAKAYGNDRPGRFDDKESRPRREGESFGQKRPFGTGRPAGAGPARGGFAAKRPGFGAYGGRPQEQEGSQRSFRENTREGFAPKKGSSFSENRRRAAGKPGLNFGSKKSVFISADKRKEMEAEAQQEAEARDQQARRHSTYEGRYEDRVRSSASLTKKRLERDGDRENMPKRPYAAGGRFAARPKPAKKEAEEGMRLNKFIAHSGVCSRRDADMYIASGSVQVNGKVITEMGYKVMPTDEVRFDGVELKAEKKVYVLLNKPKNYITTTDDPDNRHTVMELIKNAAKERIYPVGRLDRTTMGLLLFTNDGELARGIMHPSSNIKKTYHVTLDKTLTANDMGAIRGGIELEDGPVEVDGVSYIPDAPHKEVGLEIHTGRNRIVRRIFEHLGYEVVKLDRVQLGPLTKKNLPRGQWRHLTQQEVSMLKMIASGKRLPAGQEGEYGLE